MLQQSRVIAKDKKTANWINISLDWFQHVLVLIAFLMFFSYVQVATASEDSDNSLILYAVKTGTTTKGVADSNEPISAVLLKTDIEMRISGMINRVRVVQVFHNPTNKRHDGNYLFPLPENAIVDDMRIQMGEKLIETELVQSNQSQHYFSQLKKNGKRVSLLEQLRPNVFSTSISNIAPGEKIYIEISFQHMVRFEQGEFRLRMPMLVMPRYVPGKPFTEMEDMNAKYLATNSPGSKRNVIWKNRIAMKRAPVSLHIELDAGLPLLSLQSRYHAIVKTNHGPGRFSIRFANGTIPTERDFELSWQPEPSELARSAVFYEKFGDEYYYFVMLYPQEPGLNEDALLNKEVIYVIDTSGSMAGAPIRQARNALLTALKELDPEDTFNVITFNSNTRSLFEESRQASVLNIARARQFVAQINASGGSEMLPALSKALSMDKAQFRLRQIVYLTDGAVINEQTLFDVIKKEIKSSRLFTVGIGAAPNSYFLAKAAELGRGTYTFISDVNEVESRLGELLKKINRPVLHDLSIEYQPDETGKKRIGLQDLYAGEPVMFTLKTNGKNHQVNIAGMKSGREWKSQLSLSDGSEGFGIAKFWARQKINEYLRSGNTESDRQRNIQKITELAFKHNITSPFTSLLARDRSFADRQDEISRTAITLAKNTQVKINTVKGGKVIPLHLKTATDAQLKLIVGIVSLLLAILLKLLLVRRSLSREYL